MEKWLEIPLVDQLLLWCITRICNEVKYLFYGFHLIFFKTSLYFNKAAFTFSNNVTIITNIDTSVIVIYLFMKAFFCIITKVILIY